GGGGGQRSAIGGDGRRTGPDQQAPGQGPPLQQPDGHQGDQPHQGPGDQERHTHRGRFRDGTPGQDVPGLATLAAQGSGACSQQVAAAPPSRPRLSGWTDPLLSWAGGRSGASSAWKSAPGSS